MILQLSKVFKSYSISDSSSVDVLRGVELNVKQGDTIAILGQSGSGKSTLLSLIAGLDHPDEGAVLLNGIVLKDLNERDLTKYRAKQIGIIFQQFHLMPHLTALENVALPLELQKDKNANQKATETLGQIGLEHRLNHFPHQLSGGEAQRVAIARSLGIEPTLLLADEPTGNLDEETGNHLSDLLFDLVDANNMTLILVTHNRTLANRCKKQFHLIGGELQLDENPHQNQ